ncbi:MAG: DUF1893 domain-containing protein [bacterium]|nr:DUF1893 domain-containing protein [bacterium]
MSTVKQEIEKFRTSPWSLVITRGSDVLLRSNMAGIHPLAQSISHLGEELSRSMVWDRVIGRAAAFLIVHGGFRKAATPIVSKPALEILRKYKVPITYLYRVERILNTAQSDICPIERFSLDADTPEQFIKLYKRRYVVTA